MNKSDLIQLCGLWKNKTKDGEEYLSGNLNGNTKILIFKNKYKEKDNHPDNIIYISQNRKKDEKEEIPFVPKESDKKAPF